MRVPNCGHVVAKRDDYAECGCCGFFWDGRAWADGTVLSDPLSVSPGQASGGVFVRLSSDPPKWMDEKE